MLGVVFAAVAACVVWVLVYGGRVDSTRSAASPATGVPAQP